MGSFILLFSIIFLFSVAISWGLLLIRWRFGQKVKERQHIHSSVFGFFTTLYAFFIGFAIVTLWSAFLTAKANVSREAESLLIAYYSSYGLPQTEDFRLSLKSYVNAVLEEEWATMQQDTMSPDAARRFDDILTKFFQLKGDSDKIAAIYASLTEAGRQRWYRANTLHGNIYPPVWVILSFGFGSVVFGLFLLDQQQTWVSGFFEFMLIYMVLACLYFIYDLNTPFSGFINVPSEAFRLVAHKMASLP